MFDRLIESDTTDFKPRRRYFIVSSLVVGALFVSAVIVSIYAADIGLGNDTFELSAVLAPVEPPPEAPEPPQPQQQRTTNRTNEAPTRVVKQLTIDVPPPEAPPVSVTPNKYLSLPPGPVQIAQQDTAGQYNGRSDASPGTEAPSQNSSSNTEIVSSTTVDPPPPVISKPQPPKHLGIVNGMAVSLPKPGYPSPALAMGITGKVDVQITIDETGKVISAKAASGHPLLRNAAETAAWKAKFTPTLLSKVPVKVTGVIVYNFTRN
jgi:protein TonB